MNKNAPNKNTKLRYNILVNYLLKIENNIIENVS